jgi:hypothetical protein
VSGPSTVIRPRSSAASGVRRPIAIAASTASPVTTAASPAGGGLGVRCQKYPVDCPAHTGSTCRIPPAATRAARQVDGITSVAVEAQQVEGGTAAVIANAGGDRQALAGDDRDTIGARAGFKNRPRFEGLCMDPGEGCRSAVGYKDMPVVGDDTGSFREARQCRDVSPGVVIDHFDAVPLEAGGRWRKSTTTISAS